MAKQGAGCQSFRMLVTRARRLPFGKSSEFEMTKRAGLGLQEGMLPLLPEASTGHIGCEETL
jgi:hypothetical protein